MKKSLRVLLIVLVIVLLVFTILGFVAGNLLYTLALVPESDKTVVLEAEHNEMVIEYDSKEFDEMRSWYMTNTYEELWMDSSDGLGLHAYLYESDEPSHRWVIGAHGYISDGLQLVGVAMYFRAMGFNALLPDARGCGKSEGEYLGMGWHDRLDMLDWIDLVLERDPAAEIVLYGVSMGGATVMMTAGEALPGAVKAVVEDCGYTSAQDIFSYQFKALFGLPAFPLVNFASTVCSLRAGFSFTEASALNQLQNAEVPMLFLHGEKDTFVPVAMAGTLYEAAATADKQLLVIPGADHGLSALTEPELYWSTIHRFLQPYMTGELPDPLLEVEWETL